MSSSTKLIYAHNCNSFFSQHYFEQIKNYIDFMQYKFILLDVLKSFGAWIIAPKAQFKLRTTVVLT